MLPDVHNEYLASGQGKQCRFAFKVLIFASFSTIRAFDIHDKHIIRYARGRVRSLVLGHPDTLGSLPPFFLAHDTKIRLKQAVEKGRLAGRLGAKH